MPIALECSKNLAVQVFGVSAATGQTCSKNLDVQVSSVSVAPVKWFYSIFIDSIFLNTSE